MEVKMATDKQKFAYNLIYTALACKDVPFKRNGLKMWQAKRRIISIRVNKKVI